MSLRKGPSGHLRQDPSEEGMRIKKNPSLQDKSAAQKHEHVRTNALTEVLQMGGQVSDRLELHSNLMEKVEEEERGGTFNHQRPRKDSLLWKNRETLSSMKMCLAQRLLSLWSHHTSLQPLSRAIACKKYWQDVKPQWLEKLPKRFSKTVKAFLTLKKAVCKCVLDEMRRIGRSPEDISKELHLKYERALPAVCRETSGMLRQESTARKPSLGTSERQMGMTLISNNQ
ncbi:hypothetical protein F7725_006438 [Dissostichus mawsoni]|uniref:Uncharacterized protein n=1 Tax=Dissostichus mawsoni TaxID=36200 RepID=A0A7J5XTW6_DISMA|nr:hypothetical protein F7725_006438 [Dissostichus mawsoni]